MEVEGKSMLMGRSREEPFIEVEGRGIFGG